MDIERTQQALVEAIEQSAKTISEAPQDQWTIGLANSRLELLENYWTDFLSNHVELLHNEIFKDSNYFKDNQYGKTENSYAIARGQLYDIQRKLRSPTDDAGPLPREAQDTRRGLLDRIKLPMFNGIQTEWESFRDLFHSLVHGDNTLSRVEKLYYLKTHVEGEAKIALDKYPITASYYEDPWAALELRYDQRRQRVKDHIVALIRLPPLKEESAEGLQHLIDECDFHRNQLRTLGISVDQQDEWFTTVTSMALDPATTREWEGEVTRKAGINKLSYPSYEELISFLKDRTQTLKSVEACPTSLPVNARSKSISSGRSSSMSFRTLTTTTVSNKCSACEGIHYIGHCDKFKRLTPPERHRLAGRFGLCFNCLKDKCTARTCPSQSVCKTFGQQHHTLLHGAARKRSGMFSQKHTPAKVARHQNTTAPIPMTSNAILPTAVVLVSDGKYKSEKIRALLDPCSEVSLVTIGLARRLGSGLERINVGVAGVSGSPVDSARIRTHLYLHNSSNTHSWPIVVHGLQHIEIITPSRAASVDVDQLRTEFELADQDFATPNKIEAILGIGVHGQAILPGLHRRGHLLAQKTVFGWILSGAIPDIPTISTPHVTTGCSMFQSNEESQCHDQLIRLVQRFWSLEEVPTVTRRSADDAECERLFVIGHSRDETGRYIVPLPVKDDGLSLLGKSLAVAQSALASTHRRMQRDPKLAKSYRRFMDDYIKLGHMRLITPQEQEDDSLAVSYLPHHGIWQRGGNGERLRVVFNASRATSSGRSLNDALLAGPKLQNDLAVVITRWRTHRIAFCTDVQMMYRQIRVAPHHVHLQRVLWSPSSSDPALHYVLLTLTYGETCAPFLALRTLKPLCSDKGKSFPEAVDAINRNLYVDDILSGADDIESARRRRDQLIQLLKTGGFPLKKWVSNTPKLLEDIAYEDLLRPHWMQFSTDGPVSQLGIAWDPIDDCFRFTPHRIYDDKPLTKRKALAELARVFDPAGWLGPVTLVGKLIIQDLWRAKLGWDNTVPEP